MAEWRTAQLTQIAVAWVLGTVFLRWTEDNGLIDRVLSGPGDRLAAAEDAQLEYYRRHPEHNDGDWLAEQFEVLRATDAGRLLFDAEHNPTYWVPISHDAAKALVTFWRQRRPDGALRHAFTDPDWDTRFLGDLYQDLSDDAKKRYALLQTPRFVERFILDRTLTPAIEEFGLDGLRLIDPACGSGHFLLGAFERLVAAWRDQSPTLDDYEIARRALDSVHGVDTNPFAVAIARFRLLVAGLKTAGVTTLADAARQRWCPIVGCTDSLRTPERQGSFAVVDEAIGYRARWEDVDAFADERLLASGSYHAVVGNPPYITVKDPEQNAYYRERWSACHRQFQLTVPFAQRIFDLARRPSEDGLGAGYTGQITSNAFMKREFGTKLIEEFLPSIELNYVVDTSGAYIPGHGTPTVILIGRRAAPSRRNAVRAVLGVRGEPAQPDDPEKGLVWSAIEAQVEHPGSESEWVSVVDLPRSRLASHPWSLSGGGAGAVVAEIEATERRLSHAIEPPIGRAIRAGADEAFMRPARLTDFGAGLLPLMRGDVVRDWDAAPEESIWFPYASTLDIRRFRGELWAWRSLLAARRTFQGDMAAAGLAWWDYMQYTKSAYAMELSIAFAFVATHNHFVLDRGGKVFNRSAPVIKLPAGASEDDHLALLGVLNSSTACFWMKQVCHDKGNRGEGGGITSAGWERFYEFTGTKLEQFPLPADLPLDRACRLDALAQQLAATTPDALAAEASPTRDRLAVARSEWQRLRTDMISEQEELDWDVYRRYGLLSDAEAAEVLGDGSAEPLHLGERAFEIVLARKMAAGQAETQWFARHGSTPVTELPAHWPAEYRRRVEARIALIEKRRDLALIERPECKRRWSTEPWEKQQERALRHWLLDRLESRHLWFAADDNGDDQPVLHSVQTLADQLRGDEDFGSVAALWAAGTLGGADVDLAKIVGALIDDEHVPFLAAYRYKSSGLARRAEWERTWTLQRQEDAIAARLGHDDVTHPEVRRAIKDEIGDVPVPPKYGSGDFLRSSYWSNRGKLDVPKERFISYPDASRDGDRSLLLGWAGFDHREQAQALAVLISRRRGEDGWGAERVTPLLAGLAEVLPWVQQWHGEIDARYGASPADIYAGFLDGQLAELQLTRDDLATWRPTGRVTVAPLPDSRRGRGTASAGAASSPAPRTPRSAPDPAHLEAVLTAAASEPLSNERIRDLTGLDAAGARALAQHLVAEGRLVTAGQRRGMRYLLP
ncbi:BREX-2 system adenine-specific DNA-methyltransferase PglX [Pseudonocardia nigra]|uniref:BREX-2 system adenine-specific DNA-methyltransferase PglX n=1 Tax=Pseudonocardia nigra TaxID=1921578 RepID=UPI001C60180E|nr:BREX-2 system adenine-specific DNA-methyltransferase PglX [Pseudonocardia nigra]